MVSASNTERVYVWPPLAPPGNYATFAERRAAMGLKNSRCGCGGVNYDGAPNQCVSMSQATGRRCRRLRVIGATKCQWHGGVAERDRTNNVRLGMLPVFYRKHMSATLAELVEQHLALSPQEQTSLQEEIAVARVLAGDAIQLWDTARSLPDEDKRKGETLPSATMIMRDALEYVKDFCETQARIASLDKGKFSIHNLQNVVNQIVRIAHDTMHDTPGVAEQFEKAIREHIRLPTVNDGTTLTPDQDAIEMDRTVPNA